jgi:hypothetical protein
MARIARLPARLVYAAAVLGSLAFGATQAFAGSPAPPTRDARTCSDETCAYLCGGMGYCLRGGPSCACY